MSFYHVRSFQRTIIFQNTHFPSRQLAGKASQTVCRTKNRHAMTVLSWLIWHRHDTHCDMIWLSNNVLFTGIHTQVISAAMIRFHSYYHYYRIIVSSSVINATDEALYVSWKWIAGAVLCIIQGCRGDGISIPIPIPYPQESPLESPWESPYPRNPK